MKKKIFSVLASILCLTFPAYAVPSESAGMQTLSLADSEETDVSSVTGAVAGDSASVDFTGESSSEDLSFVSLSEAAELCRQNMKERNESFTIGYHYTGNTVSSEIISEETNKILDEAFAHTGNGTEGDALLWQTETWSCSSRYSGTNGDYHITLAFTMQYATTASQEEQVNSSVSSILSSLGFQCESDYEKVLAIYDALHASIAPDEEGSDSVYGVLAGGKADSEGYSLLLYRLLLDSGVDCRVVHGTKDGEEYFWNLICLGDLWYNADAFADAQGRYTYFLKSDASFSGYVKESDLSSCTISSTDYDPETSGGNESKHAAVKDAAVEASCEGNGLTKGSHCSICGEILQAQEEIPATGHTPVKTDGKEASCTSEGLTEGSVCSVCGKVLKEQETIPAKGHSAVKDPAVEATCVSEGLTEGSHCSVCGKVLVKQETVPAKGHTAVVDPAVSATCTEDGLTEGSYCSVCGKVLKSQKVVPATGHTVVKDEALEPTCTKSGLTAGKHCSVCGKVLKKQETVSPAGHTWGTGVITKQATCVENGIRTYTCTACGAVKQEIIPMTGHTPVKDSAVSASCTGSGKTEGMHCSVCGKVLSSQKTVAAEGHSWKQTGLTEGTCLSEGKATYTCTKCGAVKTETLSSRGGHTVVPDSAVSATCTQDGLTEGSHCSVCGEVLQAQKTVPALGHDWGKGKGGTEATCEKDGSAVYTCSRCGNTKTEVIPATGHTIVSEEAVPASCAVTGLTDGSYCSVCGKVFSKQETVQTLPHTWEILRISKEATCTEDGRSISICSVCGQLRTDTIPATGHEMAVDRAVAATKATSGLTEGLHCSVCGEVFVAQEIIPMSGNGNEEEEEDEEEDALQEDSSEEEDEKEKSEEENAEDEEDEEDSVRETSSLTIGERTSVSESETEPGSASDADEAEYELSEGSEAAENASSGFPVRLAVIGAAAVAGVALLVFKFVL